MEITSSTKLTDEKNKKKIPERVSNGKGTERDTRKLRCGNE